MAIAATTLAATGALAALTHWRAGVQEARAEASHPPLGQLLDVDGVQVHAHVAGSGPDLVLIHGSSGNLRDFSNGLVPLLSDHYRVISLDRPGLGYSDPITSHGASLDQQAAALAGAARMLGAERPVVMGQSLGGAVALAWALNHPDQIAALVPVSAVSHPWTTGLGAYYSVLSSWPGRHLLIPALTAFTPDRIIEDQIAAIFAPDAPPHGYADHFGPRLTLRRASMRANALQRRHLLRWISAQAPRYSDIAVPTEILHSAGDKAVGYRIHAQPLARAILGANLTTLDSASHMPHHSHPGDVLAAIDRAATRAGLH
ncbi:alpha/beta fold hydrolase [Nioella aestuarii]|uniref:alpha/beta fold hydrolase n=1 Tax=Nioella aestuarii TaxID=1662864 RepID=UPI003D7F6A25